MPQLVPFYFINQVTFVMITVLVLLYVFSTYVLPRFLSLFTSRMSITRL